MILAQNYFFYSKNSTGFRNPKSLTLKAAKIIDEPQIITEI